MQTLGVITQVATLTTAGRPIAIVPSPLVTSTSLLVPVILATAGPLVPPITICPLVVRALVTWMALVALPISIPLSVRLVAPVPPKAMPTEFYLPLLCILFIINVEVTHTKSDALPTAD